jgi:hypothetical protein
VVEHTPTSWPTTWYVMQRIAVPYEAATSALGSRVPVSTIEMATDGHLVVEAVRHARPGAVEGFNARLRYGALPWQTLSVEVSVEPWSHSESVVALRPTARPPRTNADRYFTSSLTVLDALRDELLASMPAPSRPTASVEALREAS